MSRSDARILFKYTQRMIFAVVSTSLWAALLCIAMWLVECAHRSCRWNERMEHWSFTLMHGLRNVRQHPKWGYILVICDEHTHVYRWNMYCLCTENNEAGGVMIGSIKRLNKLCDIRVGRSALNVCTCMYLHALDILWRESRSGDFNSTRFKFS